ncbi:hypothetical protein Pcar_3251 [Syntrophotalea carbinolica DSM 2380]|uniref:Uncharacterized protein n=1 Tax=Syntrophotalea carbinolica (strain DSM 2380 / NBRC 103641 / GraBd1) TaxID=338963 RepID=Q0C6R6_SYNC1|nr:hypothetical protein Pcar_3251 [Syntrophotalea carbinolica DSM 2380]
MENGESGPRDLYRAYRRGRYFMTMASGIGGASVMPACRAGASWRRTREVNPPPSACNTPFGRNWGH